MLAPSHALLPRADTFDPPRPAIYRPRHPERTDFYRLFETHFDSYRLTYDERLLERSGRLRPVVERTVDAYLECGRLLGGFARLPCASCGGEHLLAFDCCSHCPCTRRTKKLGVRSPVKGEQHA